MENIRVTGGTMPQEEINAYITRGKEKHPDKTIVGIDLDIDGEYVDIRYHFEPVSFQRIRRITGYLVGTTDRWNNAKRAEEHDRVKHDIPSSCGEKI